MSITGKLLEQRKAASKAAREKFAKQINKLIRNTGQLERKKVEEMIRILDRVKKDILDQMIGFPKGAFTRDMGAILKADIERQMIAFAGEATGTMAAAQEEFAELGAEFTGELIRSQGRRAPLLGIRPELIENAVTRSADLIRSLSLKQVGQASDIINRGIISGKSTFEVAQDMRGQFNKGISQMETIARTEMLGIHSQVQIAELQAMALDTPKLKKQWITVIDGRERPDHKAAHLKSVFVDEAFRVGPDLLQFPRDPSAPAGQVINCRCTMVPDFSEADDVAPLSEPDIQPVQVKLGGLARKVAGDVKKGFKNLK